MVWSVLNGLLVLQISTDLAEIIAFIVIVSSSVVSLGFLRGVVVSSLSQSRIFLGTLSHSWDKSAMGSLWGAFLGRTRSSWREFESFVPTEFPSGGFSSQELIRTENWRCGARCLGPVCRLFGMCWWMPLQGGIEGYWICWIQWGFTECRGMKRWSLMSNEFYSNPNLRLLLCHSSLSLEALSCGRLSGLAFGKATEFHTYFYCHIIFCCQDLLSLPCSLKHRHSCNMRGGCTTKLHTLNN